MFSNDHQKLLYEIGPVELRLSLQFYFMLLTCELEEISGCTLKAWGVIIMLGSLCVLSHVF